jgi:hypothetical protein
MSAPWDVGCGWRRDRANSAHSRCEARHPLDTQLVEWANAPFLGATIPGVSLAALPSKRRRPAIATRKNDRVVFAFLLSFLQLR